VPAGDMYIFQQDNAPTHRARATIEFLRRETPAFISPDLWPANRHSVVFGRTSCCVLVFSICRF